MFRWPAAVAGCLAVFAVCWWAWETLRLPPTGADRLGVALGVAAAASAAVGGPLFYWAGRESRRQRQSGADTGRAMGQVVVAPTGPVFGSGSDFRGARLQFSGDAQGAVLVAESQVVVGEIPREPPAFLTREPLSKLDEALGPGRVAVVCAMTGLRGVGKTQLAAAYARDRIRQGWDLVGWANAESRDSLMRDLARIAEAVGVADPEGDSLESARRLRDHLNARVGDGLLVFDNATDPDELRPFLPATGDTQVVITSTDRAFAQLGMIVDVGVFSRNESVGYLATQTGLADHYGAAAVAFELGDLPLGLAQAAAMIADQHLTYERYLERLRRVPVAELVGPARGGDYPHAVAAALLLNVQAAEDRDPSRLAGWVLRIVATLSADGVRCDLLSGLAENDQAQVDAAVQRCVAASLLTWSVAGDAVIMHRVLGRVLRERDQVGHKWDQTVAMALDLLEPQLFPEEQAWARREEGARLAVQAEALWQAGADALGDPDLARLVVRVRSWAVRQLRAAADLSRAVEFGERTVADLEREFGPGHSDTLSARHDLAEACASAGRLDKAIPLFERTLADRERLLGPDHPDTLATRHHLASAYRDAARLDEAIPLFERTLADRERVLGTDHPDTLASRFYLAKAYEWAGGPIGHVIDQYERALADRERLLGPDHPDTLITRGDLANAYYSAGILDQAIPLLERNLADRERISGQNHPGTLTSLNNLAVAYALVRRYSEAIPLYERALASSDPIPRVVRRADLHGCY
jgi:tetratricopeptide (TPR) repeat protein